MLELARQSDIEICLLPNEKVCMTLQPAPSLIISASAGNEEGNVKLPAKSFQLDIWTGEEEIKSLAQGQNRNVTVCIKKICNTILMALLFFFCQTLKSHKTEGNYTGH